MTVQHKESERLSLQVALDAQKSAKERNFMGQFATPTALAKDIVRYGKSLLGAREKVRFLDPGIGTGSFYSALLATTKHSRIEQAIGFEIDPHYGKPSRALWKEHALSIRITDFTKAVPKPREKANLIISNPPYVRHHHLTSEQKIRLKKDTESACGVSLGGLSGLYCYFLGLSHQWMEEGAISGWLVPSEFMDVNYGRQLKRYLLDRVTLLRIHRFDPNNVQFDDALVSSSVVWFRNDLPPKNHKVEFTFGGMLSSPDKVRSVAVEELRKELKWTRYPAAKSTSLSSRVCLGDLFEIKRGIATGHNGFFIMTREQIVEKNLPLECFRPVLPSARHLRTDHVKAYPDGTPLIEKPLFLLDTKLQPDVLVEKYPSLAEYIETGTRGDEPVADRYLCRSRKPWYAQENRPPAPFICTYMGRPKNGARPFRFILNDSEATACNVYLLMYPRPELERFFSQNPKAKRVVWNFLNAISPETLLSSGRVYGGGLHKMEPKELRAVSADNLLALLPKMEGISVQNGLFDEAA
jgi:adenine-specific DNA-methyltransferase